MPDIPRWSVPEIGSTLLIGHTLPRPSRIAAVTLDGRRMSRYDASLTNRGLELTVEADPEATHTLTITVA